MEIIKKFFRGRIDRRDFFLKGVVLCGGVLIAIIALLGWLKPSPESPIAIAARVISWAIYIYSFHLSILRLHDLGKPTYWIIGIFIPVVGLILTIYMLFWGSDERNKYGPKP